MSNPPYTKGLNLYWAVSNDTPGEAVLEIDYKLVIDGDEKSKRAMVFLNPSRKKMTVYETFVEIKTIELQPNDQIEFILIRARKHDKYKGTVRVFGAELVLEREGEDGAKEKGFREIKLPEEQQVFCRGDHFKFMINL